MATASASTPAAMTMTARFRATLQCLRCSVLSVAMVATRSRLQSVPTGVRPTTALVALVSELKAGDPLRPVTVVMPSALSAVSVRRSLGREGFVATEFVTLPSLVPRLAARQLARHRREPVRDLEARMLVRAVLADGRSRLSELGRHPSTLAALVDT